LPGRPEIKTQHQKSSNLGRGRSRNSCFAPERGEARPNIVNKIKHCTSIDIQNKSSYFN